MNTVIIGNLEWSHTLPNGERVNYKEAEKAVAALGYGWRIPTIRELFSLVDHLHHDPAIDTEKFPDTRSYAYWSSTPCAWNAAAVWVVYFDYGHTDSRDRSHSACIRAVRDVVQPAEETQP